MFVYFRRNTEDIEPENVALSSFFSAINNCNKSRGWGWGSATNILYRSNEEEEEIEQEEFQKKKFNEEDEFEERNKTIIVVCTFYAYIILSSSSSSFSVESWRKKTRTKVYVEKKKVKIRPTVWNNKKERNLFTIKAPIYDKEKN